MIRPVALDRKRNSETIHPLIWVVGSGMIEVSIHVPIIKTLTDKRKLHEAKEYAALDSVWAIFYHSFFCFPLSMVAGALGLSIRPYSFQGEY